MIMDELCTNTLTVQEAPFHIRHDRASRASHTASVPLSFRDGGGGGRE